MLEYDEDIEQEIAPDLSTIKKNKTLLTDMDTNTIFSNKISKSTSRISEKRTSGKKAIAVKKVIGDSNKIDKHIEPLKSVYTINSVSSKNTDIVSYYANMKVDENTINEDYDEDEEDDEDEDDDEDEVNGVKSNHSTKKKVNTIKEKFNDEEKEKLKGIIKLFLAADEKCSKITQEAKEIRDEKKQYEEYILDFMGEKKKEKIIHNDSILRRNVKESRPKPKEENILKTLQEVFNDPDVAYEITKKIFDSVPSEEKVTLKREKDDDTNKAKKVGKK